MAKLTYRQRHNLRRNQFAIPEQRRYPIEDKAHARNALARVSQHGTLREQDEVRAAVERRYPSIDPERRHKHHSPSHDGGIGHRIVNEHHLAMMKVHDEVGMHLDGKKNPFGIGIDAKDWEL